MSAGNWKDMFSAACEGDLALVEYHVERGVDVNYVHPEILGTALVACIQAGHEDVALYLIDHGADPNLVSEFEGLAPLDAARKAGSGRVEAKLVERGAVARMSTPSGTSADGSAPSGGWLSRLWGGRG
ncbi:MAG: ankyrin repeat domain-containing protein [Acidobacteriota bacterium]